MVNKLIDGVSFLKSKFQTDQLDEKLNQAVSEENWQASTQLLHEIANASYNYEKEQRILTFILEKLKHKSWKKVLKTLHLVDFLLKYGPTSLTATLKENIYEFRNFDNYTLVADGIDRGESIRKQSKVVVALLSDDHFLTEERAKAKQIKDRMANVIGSSVYYGSFSNDGSGNAPAAGKKETYESFSSSSFNKSGSLGSGYNSGASMSFGESVMRTLQQARKTEEPTAKEEYSPPQAEKPSSKLNLSKMNQRKPEEQKKNFNALSMKLVKPPEKKPVEKKVEATITSKPQQQQQQHKPTGKVNIMDLDFLSFNDNPQQIKPQTVTNSNNNNSDLFDFLGTPSPSPARTAPSLPLNDPKPQPPPQHAPLYNSSSFPAFNYNQPTQTPSFSFSAPQQMAPISISLSSPQQPASTSQSSGSSLIDFSNFREELTQIGHTEEKKSAMEWNW